MSLRSRLVISVVAGALAAAAAATPAVAGEDWQSSGGNGNNQNQSQNQSQGQGQGQNWSQSQGQSQGQSRPQSQNPRLYKGVVTADTLLLRSAPNRGSQVIRTVRRGQIVQIYCKTVGQNIQGNPLWYLLPDGTWAWGSARYIDNIGAAPRWC
ncbi:SH3 domain-containing protein [Streptomyces sp. NPDC000983]|uniref:SH3 domain-containing protein n=1 Tax=Streptomyces sp. NPDC000983 TaxID=3154373 RepID=UPI003323875D